MNPCDRQNRVTKPTRWTEMEQLLNFQCTEGIYILNILNQFNAFKKKKKKKKKESVV